MILFDVIVADNPWAFKDKLAMSSVPRGAEANYETMTLEELCALKVPSADDALLALWCPSTMLFSHGGPCMEAWGFDYKSLWVWGKCTKGRDGLAFGMGHTFRQAHEVALIGIKGRPVIQNKGQRSMLVLEGEMAPNEGHSIKPEGLQDSLDLMFPEANKLEMFARRHRDDWVCIGNQLTGNDIRVDLEGL